MVRIYEILPLTKYIIILIVKIKIEAKLFARYWLMQLYVIVVRVTFGVVDVSFPSTGLPSLAVARIE